MNARVTYFGDACRWARHAAGVLASREALWCPEEAMAAIVIQVLVAVAVRPQRRKDPDEAHGPAAGPVAQDAPGADGPSSSHLQPVEQ